MGVDVYGFNDEKNTELRNGTFLITIPIKLSRNAKLDKKKFVKIENKEFNNINSESDHRFLSLFMPPSESYYDQVSDMAKPTSFSRIKSQLDIELYGFRDKNNLAALRKRPSDCLFLIEGSTFNENMAYYRTMDFWIMQIKNSMLDDILFVNILVEGKIESDVHLLQSLESLAYYNVNASENSNKLKVEKVERTFVFKHDGQEQKITLHSNVDNDVLKKFLFGKACDNIDLTFILGNKQFINFDIDDENIFNMVQKIKNKEENISGPEYAVFHQITKLDFFAVSNKYAQDHINLDMFYYRWEQLEAFKSITYVTDRAVANFSNTTPAGSKHINRKKFHMVTMWNCVMMSQVQKVGIIEFQERQRETQKIRGMKKLYDQYFDFMNDFYFYEISENRQISSIYHRMQKNFKNNVYFNLINDEVSIQYNRNLNTMFKSLTIISISIASVALFMTLIQVWDIIEVNNFKISGVSLFALLIISMLFGKYAIHPLFLYLHKLEQYIIRKATDFYDFISNSRRG